MPTVPPGQIASPPVAAGSPQVRASIARASARTGNDFDYMLAQARLESHLDPSARARTSSATGLYQFTSATWLKMIDAHGAQHGLGWADAAIENGAIRDPATRAQVMALRLDPDASAMMAGEFANDNRAGLTAALGRAPDHAELYLAHFLGLDGAKSFLSAMDADPAQSAAALLPRAAAANRAVFYDRAGAPRSLAGVMDLLRGKLAAAGGVADAAPPGRVAADTAPPVADGGPVSREFDALAARMPEAPARPSMAETVRSAFGGDGGGALPAHVSAAYARLAALGL
ncbi:lytic transglycosylase domain-containing protein [Novosphingobium sp. ZN18A2]|uniref:lytic transglycosylase domain-containing protein n=1 Tax=Novosphingobium sp. ZN18A2 TaxID=3079861 RepID=UPI0030D0A34A